MSRHKYVVITQFMDQGQTGGYQQAAPTLPIAMTIVAEYIHADPANPEFNFEEGHMISVELITGDEWTRRGWDDSDAIDIYG